MALGPRHAGSLQAQPAQRMQEPVGGRRQVLCGRSSTVLRLYGLALDRAAQGWFLSLVKRRSVSIGKCTSDNGVDVHGKRVSTCTVASYYAVASLMVTALPWHRPCRSGDNGGGLERPPSTRPLDRARRACTCARLAPPLGGGAPVRLGDFRAGVAGLASKAETEENTEDTWKRCC